jgi:glycosyltransferase involved in cell wall biosynthesis
LTVEKLRSLEQQGYRVINQHNQGLAAARNNGIRVASGPYILPLDSDNRLHANYLTKAIDILDSNPELDIVYGDAQFFGAKAEVNQVGVFDFPRMLVDNSIDACAVYRKKVWEELQGYDGNMPRMGHEDWEFWIHAFVNGKKFHYLQEVGFYYRWMPGSMIRDITQDMLDQSRQYIHRKHATKIIPALLGAYSKLEQLQRYLVQKRIKSGFKLLLNLPVVERFR